MRVELNLVGLCCAVPQLLAYSKIKKLKEGDVLEIVVEKGSSQERDIVNLIEYFKLDVTRRENGDEVRYTLKIDKAILSNN
ncbi:MULTISPECIES: sulfurtransferase TusA family protein [Acidianus]|uniref:Oxidoreductase n=1 Tax=Candidatus Acidianus copahuensis TaxID=1160895 RepID=A0A031LPY9_9CREN|nr:MULTISPECIES: sulfurtransferase TusA family protein [Acidianus]EZQ07076.1 oxidoreductase [Candidatus Acidianus copahuensis]NON62619.1 sulfurtransferase TusA family protein [Acidianus sp. RZ1]